MAKPMRSKIQAEVQFRDLSAQYYNTLYELYCTTFKWENLPDYMVEDGGEIYLENILTTYGKVFFFKDEDLDMFLVSMFTGYGINFYNQPTNIQITNPTGYSKQFKYNDGVIIYNSPFRTAENIVIRNFAEKLAQCDLTILLNLNVQKTPYMINTTKDSLLSIKNIMSKIDNFEPAIITSDNLNPDSIQVLNLNPPYLGGNIYELKRKYWEEALAYCGISSGTGKKERVIVNEQASEDGESNALLITRLKTREMAAENINRKFGLDIKVCLRQDLDLRVEALRRGIGGEEDGEIYDRTSEVD